ncbi:MAG: hypothetical protein JW726_19870 [Anaerolineales bacterium]|nr:hypothetical protein [Anaerolineales bacterium]
MSVLDRLACAQGRRDEVPNQTLARQLVEAKDAQAIAVLAENLWNKKSEISSDCLKVLYEVGYLDAALIAPYSADFIRLLKSRNNRMVWGAMIALSTVAELAADAIYPQRAAILKAMAHGSVITMDAGVKTLAGIASTSAERRQEIFPYLLQHLATCRPKDVPQHAESTLRAVDAENMAAFVAVLQKRLSDLAGAQVKRVEKVIKKAKG